MVKLNRIYTRAGDDGTTALVGGGRVSKDHRRVEAYGDLDELNSFVGWARTLAEARSREPLTDQLAAIQNRLFDIGSLLATPDEAFNAGDERLKKLPAISDKHIAELERWIDETLTGLAELRSFVLPGGSELNSALHICRTVCRRVERRVVGLRADHAVPAPLITYLNRLSDLFFALARRESAAAGSAEYLWRPGGDDSNVK